MNDEQKLAGTKWNQGNGEWTLQLEEEDVQKPRERGVYGPRWELKESYYHWSLES